MAQKAIKIKTSISLPENTVAVYRALQKQLLRLASASDVLANLPSRDRARCYNRQNESFTVVQVYWPLEAYNKLHTIAAALRVSVSLLVYWMLLLMENKSDPRHEKFSNYSMVVKSWSANCIHIEEKIQFQIHPDEDDEDIPIAA